MTFVLAGLLALSMSGSVALFVAWRADARDLRHIRDLLDAKDDMADALQSERDVLTAKLKVSEDLAEQERTLRLVATVQRDEAQRRVRELLKQHIPKATDDEIREITADVFASPLSLVPLSKQPGNELLEPE